MKEYVMSGVVLIFGLFLASLGFLGGYYVMQNYFAVPKAVEAFVEEYRQGAYRQSSEDGGFVAAREKKEKLNGKAAPASVRLDIYYVLKEKPEAFISVLDSGNGTWSLYTLPPDTRVVLGETRYRRLSARYPALPQMFEIGILPEYMGQEQVAGVLSEVLSDILFCSFKTAVTCTEEELAAWCIKIGEEYVPTQEVMEFFVKRPSERGVWEKFASLEDEGLSYYAETIGLLQPQDIRAQLIAGERVSDGYQLSENAARRQMAGSGL